MKPSSNSCQVTLYGCQEERPCKTKQAIYEKIHITIGIHVVKMSEYQMDERLKLGSKERSGVQQVG